MEGMKRGERSNEQITRQQDHKTIEPPSSMKECFYQGDYLNRTLKKIGLKWFETCYLLTAELCAMGLAEKSLPSRNTVLIGKNDKNEGRRLQKVANSCPVNYVVLNSQCQSPGQGRALGWQCPTMWETTVYTAEITRGPSCCKIRAGKGSNRRRLWWKHLQKAREASDYGRSWKAHS